MGMRISLASFARGNAIRLHGWKLEYKINDISDQTATDFTRRDMAREPPGA